MILTFRAGPPTERQVKRWAFGLKEMLSDLRGYQEFEVFLQKEFSSENLHFWTMCQTLKGLPLSQVESKVTEIYKYVSTLSICIYVSEGPTKFHFFTQLEMRQTAFTAYFHKIVFLIQSISSDRK